MNYRLFSTLVTLMLILTSYSVEAVGKVNPISKDTSLTKEQHAPLLATPKKEGTVVKGTKKLQKRLKRLKKRVKKLNNSFGSILRSSKFRLGALLLLLGLAAGFVINVLSLPGILGWLAGIVALAGVVYMVWGLFEHS